LKNPYLENGKWYWFDKKHREQLLQIGNDIFGPYEKYEQALKYFIIYHKLTQKLNA